MKKIVNISSKDYEEIKKIIKETWLSDYLLDSKDLVCYKDNDRIIAFWRIFNIEGDDHELWSLYVNEEYRWKKLWVELMKDLLNNKKRNDWNLYLACKRVLESYYWSVWFKQITENIPEKLLYTLKWAKENNMDAIVMKYID